MDTMYKRKMYVNIFMRTLYKELVVFQQSRICFCYITENEIIEDILGWNPSSKRVFNLVVS